MPLLWLKDMSGDLPEFRVLKQLTFIHIIRLHSERVLEHKTGVQSCGAWRSPLGSATVVPPSLIFSANLGNQ